MMCSSPKTSWLSVCLPLVRMSFNVMLVELPELCYMVLVHRVKVLAVLARKKGAEPWLNCLWSFRLSSCAIALGLASGSLSCPEVWSEGFQKPFRSLSWLGSTTGGCSGDLQTLGGLFFSTAEGHQLQPAPKPWNPETRTKSLELVFSSVIWGRSKNPMRFCELCLYQAPSPSSCSHWDCPRRDAPH